MHHHIVFRIIFCFVYSHDAVGFPRLKYFMLCLGISINCAMKINDDHGITWKCNPLLSHVTLAYGRCDTSLS